MALQCRTAVGIRPMHRIAPAAPVRRFAPVVCKAQKSDEPTSKVALPLAAMVAAGLLFSGLSADEALAARSGGRVGGGSFSGARARSAPRSAPSSRGSSSYGVSGTASRSARAAAGINSSQRMGSYSAPPVVVAPVYASPFGFGMPFFGGYGGFGYGIPMFGGLFQFFFLSIMISVVFNVISGFVNRSSSGSSKKSSKLDSEDWDEL